MLKKRPKIASQLDGVIDLERLHSGPSDSIERDAARFFELTFPSDEVHALLRALGARFSSEHSAGTILAQAVKGLGESHTLLLAYHLFKSAPAARPWMAALGYVFLKSGFSDTRLKSADRPLNGKRFRFFSPEEALPANVPGRRVDEPRRLAILTGRAHNRPQGPSASQSVYRHGGLSIMEMLTPWLVLGPVGSI